MTWMELALAIMRADDDVLDEEVGAVFYGIKRDVVASEVQLLSNDDDPQGMTDGPWMSLGVFE